MSDTTPGRIQKTRESVKHTFTDAEILDFCREQNRDIQRLKSLEEEKDQAVADFKAQIKAIETKVYDLSRRVNQQYEFRIMDCEWHMHVPEQGKKTLIRVDTHEEVKVQDMDTFEKQEVLFDEPELKELAISPDDAAPDPAAHPLATDDDKNVPWTDDDQEPVTNFRRETPEEIEVSHQKRRKK